MTLDQLRIFVAVAERQHMTRAAEALHIAQSAVSTAISGFEGRHNAKLFDRVGRGIALTEAGRILLVEARAVLARAAAAELALAELGGLKRGTLSVMASQTIASYWLPRHLVTFRQRHPGIDIKLAVGNTAQVARAVHEGTAEIGFVEGAVDDPVLIGRTVARDRLIVVVAPGHALAGITSIEPAAIAHTEWVLREPGSGTRSVFEAAMAALAPGTPLRIALELPSNEAVRATVEAGLGATAISASVAAPSIEAGLLVPVALELPERDFTAIRHAERYQSRAVDSLLAIMAGS